MELSFTHGPWNVFLDGKSGEHDIRLMFDEQSTIVSIVWDTQGTETVGLVLEWLKIFVAKQNPGLLVEKSGLDCLEIAKKEGLQTHWFVLIHSPPAYCSIEQTKLDTEMEEARLAIIGSEKKLLAMAKTMNIELKRLEEMPSNVKSVFFGAPIVLQSLSHKLAQYKAAQENPVGFMPRHLVSQGEFWVGRDAQQQTIKEPLGLFRRTAVMEGSVADRLHVLHLMIESALLSGIPVLVFDSGNQFSGLQQANPQRNQLEKAKVSLEPLGFPAANFVVPEKIRINISTLDTEAVLELFRAGKNPAMQTIQKILSSNEVSNLSQLVESIQVQSPLADVTAYQLRKASRIALLLEKTYPGFFNGPNDLKELAKSWSTGLGRAALIRLDGLDERIKTILFHSLVRELLAQYQNTQEPSRPIKIMIVLPEPGFLFSRHEPWKIHKLIENDLQKASSQGIASVISAESMAIPNTLIFSQIQTQISIVNEDDVGIRIENRKPYRVVLRPPLSTCSENPKRAPYEDTLSSAARMPSSVERAMTNQKKQ